MTGHFTQLATLASQVFCFLPRQVVPVTIQQKMPLPNCLPGQAFWHSAEHFMTFQQGWVFRPWLQLRNSSSPASFCTYGGHGRQP